MRALSRNVSALWHMAVDSEEDLAGAALLGDPDDILGGVAERAAHGDERLILDARGVMDRFEEVIELIRTEVLPRV